MSFPGMKIYLCNATQCPVVAIHILLVLFSLAHIFSVLTLPPQIYSDYVSGHPEPASDQTQTEILLGHDV